VVGAAADEILERSVANVSQEHLTAHIAELARRTKHAGTPGELEDLVGCRPDHSQAASFAVAPFATMKP